VYFAILVRFLDVLNPGSADGQHGVCDHVVGELDGAQNLYEILLGQISALSAGLEQLGEFQF
jgi:hypothetical protein